jgi:transposase
MYANLVKAPRGRHRRTYPDDFKTQVVAACLQPGVSMAAVALANGLNANLLRRWVKAVRGGGMPAPTAGSKDAPAGRVPRESTSGFVDLGLLRPAGEVDETAVPTGRLELTLDLGGGVVLHRVRG